MAKLLEFPSAQESIEALALKLSENVGDVLKGQNSCSFALAGGNTPKPLYQYMSCLAWPWDRIKVTLTDERWVPRKSEDSNENMIRDCLMREAAEKAHLVGLKNKEPTPEKGQDFCETTLNKSISPLDIVILGMGEDGHIASIFPSMENTETLLNRFQPRLCMAANPKELQPRMSLTLSYLLSAKHIYLFISGDKKKAIIDKAIDKTLSKETHPIVALIREREDDNPVNIYWTPA
jgi:6-phosphogluconolactonase